MVLTQSSNASLPSWPSSPSVSLRVAISESCRMWSNSSRRLGSYSFSTLRTRRRNSVMFALMESGTSTPVSIVAACASSAASSAVG